LVLRLRVQQLRIDRAAKEERVNCLILIDVIAREEGLEVGVGAVIARVQTVGREVGALGSEMWTRRLLWYALAMLQKGRVGDSRLMRELLGLGSG
jgi:hypothetical protein